MEFIVMRLQDVRKLSPRQQPNELVEVDLGQAVPVPRAARGNLAAGVAPVTAYSLPMKERPGELFTTQQAACEAAQKAAETNPGEVWVVYNPLVVFEAKKPEKIDVIVKEFNSAGELVIMKE